MRQLRITPQITNRDSLSFDKYLQEISTIPLITQEEEIELANKIKEGDEKALGKLVESNLRFVISAAKQYQNSGMRLPDLISAGNEGMIIAAKKFDPSRGFKFISYAVWWIRQSILQFITVNGKSIRLPSNQVGMIQKIKKISDKLEQIHQRNPTLEEISEQLAEEGKDLTPTDIEYILMCGSPVNSLDVKITEDEDCSLIDIIKAETMEDVNISLDIEDLNVLLLKIFNERLSPREKQVVIDFYGLFGNQAQTLDEIGVRNDLTRERVRQIKEKAIRKIKYSSVKRRLKEYV